MATKQDEKADDKFWAGKAKEEPTAKPAEKKEVKAVVPAQPAGKGETRLFQLGPDERAWLTQSEAEAKGFYWRDEKKHGKA